MSNSNLPDPLDVALGVAIRVRRKSIQLSQERLAERCGVTFQQIQKYERGTNRVSFSRLVQIANAMGCKVADLVGMLDTSDESGVEGLDAISHLKVSGAVELLTAYEGMSPDARVNLLKFLNALAPVGEQEVGAERH